MEICETDSRSSVEAGGLFSNMASLSLALLSSIFKSTPVWLKVLAAILDLENNRIHCSPNNSLYSFSAPDGLLPLEACYTTRIIRVYTTKVYIFKLWSSNKWFFMYSLDDGLQLMTRRSGVYL